MASTGGSDGAPKSEPSSSISRSSSSKTTEPTSLTIQVLQDITDNFSEERLLGQGGYGKVYKGVYVNGEEIAVKLLYNNMQAIDDKQFQHEFDNLMMLNHPNIVRLVGYCYETQRQHREFQGRIVFGETTYKALCFEYMHKGSLRRHLSDEFSGLDWQTRYKIIRGTCEGLKYLHKGLKQPIYHMDLKPDNILLDENMVAKLADSGLSKLFDEEQTKVTQSTVGTIGYMPPEYLCGHVVSKELDIFSLGVVMTQIIGGPKGHTRCAEMAYQDFLNQVCENWRNRLEKTCTSSLILKAYCKQVKICTEIGVRCMELDRQKRPSIVDIVCRLDETEAMIDEVTDFPGKQAKQYSSSEARPTPIQPGSVQLVMKYSRVTPLMEYNKKVMLELTGGDYTSDRPGLDLVAVVDIRRSMGDKIDELKTAMRFLVRKLSPMDRLSIINFYRYAEELWPLTQITEAAKRDLEHIISDLQPSISSRDIADGLQDGLNVLAGREVRVGRVAAIMLVSSGKQCYAQITSVDVGDVPVYTFCLGGTDSDPTVLARVAAKSMGGTFSHVSDRDTGGLTMAFSQCLAGLLTVAVQNLELTVAAVRGQSTIVKVTTGSYPQKQNDDSVTVRFGNLYSREVRKVIVELHLPTSHRVRSAGILDVTYTHNQSAARVKFVAPTETLTVWCTGVEFSEEAGLLTEEARLQTGQMIEEARTMAENNRLDDARDKLVEAQNMPGEQSNSLLSRTELKELFQLFRTRETYEKQVRPCVLSFESSHNRQRLTHSGGDIKFMRLFTTPRMDKYLKQAMEFLKDPMMRLPSVEDDVKEEVGAVRGNVASRKEEMRRFALDVKQVPDLVPVPVQVQVPTDLPGDNFAPRSAHQQQDSPPPPPPPPPENIFGCLFRIFRKKKSGGH